MNIMDFLCKDAITVDLKAQNKKDANVLSEQIGVLGISKKGIDFNSLDGEPVYIIFLLVGPVEVTGQHLKALSRISRLFKDKFLRQAIKDAQTKEDIVKIIQQEDSY